MKTTKTIVFFLCFIALSIFKNAYAQTPVTTSLTVVGMDTTNPGGFNCPNTISIFFKFESSIPHSNWKLVCPSMLLLNQTGEWSEAAGAIIRADIAAPLKRNTKYFFEVFLEINGIESSVVSDTITNLPGKGCDATVSAVNITSPSFLGTEDGSIELALNKSYCGLSGPNTLWYTVLKNLCSGQVFPGVADEDIKTIKIEHLAAGSYEIKYQYLGDACIDSSFEPIVLPAADGSTIFVKSKYYKDGDGDLFGDNTDFIESCTPVDNRVLAGGDCDDNDASVNPGKTEIPGNGKDDDCDGAIDEPVIIATYYADFDHDGFGNPSFPLQAEEGHQPTGYVTNNVDCDDADPEVPTQDLTMKPLWHKTNPFEIGFYAAAYEYKPGKNRLPVTVAATKDSGVVVAGTKYYFQGNVQNYPSHANADFYLQRFDKNGSKLWEKSFGFNNGFVTTTYNYPYNDIVTQVAWSPDYATSSIQTSDGGFAVGGTSYYATKAGYTWCVIDRVTCIQCPETVCNTYPLGSTTPAVIKTDENGNQLWSWSLPADFLYSGELFKIKETKDNGIICLGRRRKQQTKPGDVINSSLYNSDLIPDENTKYYIVKLSANGTEVWQKEIDFYSTKQINDYFTASPVDITETSDGNFICTGRNYFYQNDPREFTEHNVLFKLSSGGELIWSNNMDEVKTPGLITAADNGSFYFVADAESSGQTQKLQLQKMDGSGNTLWSKVMPAGDTYFNIPSGISKTQIAITSLDTNKNGNIIVATPSRLFQLLPDGDLFRENKIDSSNYAGAVSADRGYFSLQFNETTQNALKLSKYGEPQINDLCNGKDDDCDGLIDEDAPEDLWYRDNDGDGFGNLNNTIRNCSKPDGYVSDSSDCNDANALINPDAKEICNGIDDDCNGIIDDLFPNPVIISPASSPVFVCLNYYTPPLAAMQGNNFSYQWKLDGKNILNATTPYLQPAVAGAYRVKVTAPGGCSILSEVKSVKIIAPVTATITPGSDLDLCTPKRGQVLLIGPAYQNVSYVWHKINTDGSVSILGVSKNYTATTAGEYRLTVRTIPDCYESTTAVTVVGKCKGPSSIAITANEESADITITKKTTVLLYPNPANNVLHVSGLGSVKGNIEIVNMTAQTVYKQQVYGNNISIDISRFANGVYLFKYNNGSTVKTIKFIKQ